jgi:truncated hemoglobin YjbI
MTTQTSLYERLGGSAAIDAATELFYRKVLADPLLAAYFDDVDMDRQIAKQAAFLTMALGGPNAYTGRDLRAAHAALEGIRDEHVDRVLEHLAQSLRELGVSEADIAAAGAVADSVRDDVLNR